MVARRVVDPTPGLLPSVGRVGASQGSRSGQGHRLAATCLCCRGGKPIRWRGDGRRGSRCPRATPTGSDRMTWSGSTSSTMAAAMRCRSASSTRDPPLVWVHPLIGVCLHDLPIPGYVGENGRRGKAHDPWRHDLDETRASIRMGFPASTAGGGFRFEAGIVGQHVFELLARQVVVRSLQEERPGKFRARAHDPDG